MSERSPIEEQVIALAGIAQAARLVDQIARTVRKKRQCNPACQGSLSMKLCSLQKPAEIQSYLGHLSLIEAPPQIVAHPLPYVNRRL